MTYIFSIILSNFSPMHMLHLYCKNNIENIVYYHSNQYIKYITLFPFSQAVAFCFLFLSSSAMVQEIGLNNLMDTLNLKVWGVYRKIWIKKTK